MTITKPNTQQIIVGVALFLALIATFFPWASFDAGFMTINFNAFDFTRGVFIFLFVLLALAAWASQLFITQLPPNLQMASMAAPFAILALAALSLLLTLTITFKDYTGGSRGFGQWLELLTLLAVIVVSALQAKPLLEAAQAMKAAQQTPPPGDGGFPPAPPTV